MSATFREPSFRLKEGENMRTFNEIVGEIGSFQKWTAFLILLSGVTVSWETLSFVFLTRDFGQTCSDPPDIDMCSDDCKQININGTMKTYSILYQWHLFCSAAYKEQLAQTVLILGIMFGCLFYGHLADQLGRRPTFLSACMLAFIMGIMVGLSPWYWFFCLTRFVMGIGCGGMTIICIVFLVEYVDFKRREFMVVMFRIPYTVGHAMLAPIAFYLPSWRVTQIVTSSFAIVYVSYFWLIPESPRWLFITGQLERCISVLQSGAKFNRRPTEKVRDVIEKAYDEMRTNNFKRNGTMVDLFRSRNLCKKTCILSFGWFSLYLLFYGVLDYFTYMKGDMYMDVGISSWLTIPSTIIAYPVLRYIDRRYSLLMTFGLSSIAMWLVPFMPESETDIGLVVLSAFVLALMSITFCIMHIFSTESYPTMLRNSGMGFNICSARLGCLVAQYVSPMSSRKFWLPAIIFSVFSVGSTIVLLFMPETRGRSLTDTIEEGEKFVGKKSFSKQTGSVNFRD